MIFVLGAGGILLLAMNNKYSKWGMVLGLIAQPFWYMHAYMTGSWGFFAENIVYTAFYIFGVYNWFKKQRMKKCSR